MVVNEIQAYVTLPGMPIVQARTIGWGYDAQGNATSRTAIADGIPVSFETFAVDYMNRISAYTGQNAAVVTVASHSYLFMPTGQRLASADLLAGTSEFYMSDGEDVVADYAPGATGGFVRTQSYVQSLAIDSKHVRIDDLNQVSYYIPDALGSVGVQVNAAGVVTDTRITNAWGEDLPARRGTGTRNEKECLR